MIILLSGYPNSGKNYVAEKLKKKYLLDNLSVCIFDIAKYLKYLVSKNNNIPLKYFYERNLKDKKIKNLITPRELLISSAKYLKEKDENIFVKKVPELNYNINIISDIRYKHEVEYFKKKYKDEIFVHIWIERNNITENDNMEITKNNCDITYVNI